MSTIYHIFKAYAQNDLLPSSHKIQLCPKLRYVLRKICGLIVRQARIICLSDLQLAGRVA